ncbi:MAG: 3-oxoacyl-ACP reductase FabG [Clostridia bacterium]|nr:3-oxoacyl-ACP reductase FabG [Clostridia bacterium]
MKKIVVTGGSRGIGAAIVRRFAENGDMVAFIYKNAVDMAKELCCEYKNVYAVEADVSTPGDASAAAKKAVEILGGCDVLVNNAGIAQSKLIVDITDEDFKKMMDTNLTAAFCCSREVIPEFLKTHSGVIINIASMWGEVGASMEVHYSASKAALIGMTKAMAKELGYSGIRVNCVSPGMIDTDMNSCYDEEIVKSIVDEIPLSRIGAPKDVANAVFFLSSEDASYITGQVLSVNGGMVI